MGENIAEFSELNVGGKMNPGIDEELVTAWLSETNQCIDAKDVLEQNPNWACPICLENVKVDLLVKICSDIGNAHIFHKRCLHKWLVKCNNCPVCRRPGIVSALAEFPNDDDNLETEL